MFTGIIQGQAIVANIIKDSNTFTIKTDLDLSDCKIGSSIKIYIFPLRASSIIFSIGESEFKKLLLVIFRMDIFT